jgi:hypothetical protein
MKYKFWDIRGTKGEYVFLTATAKCETESDVRAWMSTNHPTIGIASITDARMEVAET